MIVPTSDPVRRLLDCLGDSVKQTGAGRWAARCPAHDDQNPSLTVSIGDDGRVLLKCQAGCSFNAIMAALKLAPRDAFPPSNGNERSPVIARYVYCDSEAQPIARKCRTAAKQFFWQRPEGNDWANGRNGQQIPLYNLPAILNHREDRPDEFVVLVEGEKDADNVAKQGFTATTSPDGASKDTQRPKWEARYTETLAGLRVVIICDNDDAGHAHGRNAAKCLQGRAAEVRLIEAMPEGAKDVSDWIATGGTGEQLLALIETVPAWNPEQPEQQEQPKAEPKPERFTFHTAAEFDKLDLRREYHVPGILAAGPPTVLAGSFKTLKTSIAADLAISCATGSAFLGHFNVTKPCHVAMMSGESGGFALQSLLRRVAKSKAWTMESIGSFLHVCTAVPNAGKDLADIQRFIDAQGIELLFLDPAYLMMQGMRSDDAGNLFAMAQYLDPVGKISERTGCTIVIIHHNSRGATRNNVGEPAELADIAWSGFAEWAGQWLLLSRRERFDPDSNGEHFLWLSAGGRDGHSNLVGVNVTEGRIDDPGGMRWEVSVERAASVRREAVTVVQEQREQDRRSRLEKQAEQDRQAIMEAARKLKEPETKTGLRDRSGLNSSRFNPVFAALVTGGQIVPQEVKKGNGRSYEGYIAAPHQDASGRNGIQPENPGVASGTGLLPLKGESLSYSDAPDGTDNVRVSECPDALVTE